MAEVDKKVFEKEPEKETPVEKKPEEEKIAPVVTAKAKKKSKLQKAMGSIFVQDLKSVGKHLWSDVLYPSMLNLIVTTVTNGINDLVYGISNGAVKNGPARGRRSNSGSYKPYRDYYDTPPWERYDDYDRRGSENRTRRYSDLYNIDEVIEYKSKSDAELVLSRMRDRLDKYPVVRVSEMYEFSGIQDYEYTLNDYGWATLADAEVVNRRGIWVIRMPKPLPIKLLK